MHGLNLGHDDTNKHSSSHSTGKSFFGWVKHQAIAVISQLAVIASVGYFIVSFVYYLTNSKYNQYLDPGAVQQVVFWMNIIMVLLFIFALVWVIDKNTNGKERAEKTYRKIFGGNLDSDDAWRAQKRLKKFKLWFLAFWVAMLALYLCFLVQGWIKPHPEHGKKEVLGQFSELLKKGPPASSYSSKNGAVESATDEDQELLNSINRIKDSIETSHEIRSLKRDNEILDGIVKLPSGGSNADIAKLDEKLAEIIKSVRLVRVHEQVAKINPSESQRAIVEKVISAHSSNDLEKKKAIIKEAQVLIDANPLSKANSYEGKIFTAIKDIEIGPSTVDTEKLRKSIASLSEGIKSSGLIDTTPNGAKINENLIKAEASNDLAEKQILLSEAAALVNTKSHYEEMKSKTLFSWLTFAFNTFGSWLIFVCFLKTAGLSKGRAKRRRKKDEKGNGKSKEERVDVSDLKLVIREKRKFYFSFAFLIVLIWAFPLTILAQVKSGITESALTSTIVFFDGFSGILNCVVLALLIARLDSKLIGLPSYLIGVLYFYAAFQPLFVVFEQPGEIPQIIKTVVLVAVLVAKIYFFLIIMFAAQTGRLLTYLYCFPTMSNRVDAIWTNPYLIEAEERDSGYRFHIRKHGNDIFSGEITATDHSAFRDSITQLKSLASLRANYKKIFTTDTDAEIYLADEQGNAICTSDDASMSEARAEHVIDECAEFIPDCEVKLRNANGIIRTLRDVRTGKLSVQSQQPGIERLGQHVPNDQEEISEKHERFRKF